MSQFIPVEGDDEQFFVEVIPVEGQSGIKQRSRDNLAEKLTKDDFKQMIRQAVMPACQTFVDVWQELNQPLTAERAEVEFNLGFTANGSAVLVQASGQASFKVKVTWKFEEYPRFEMRGESGFEMKGESGTEGVSLLSNDVLKAQKDLEKAVEADYGSGGGLLLSSNFSISLMEKLKTDLLNEENVNKEKTLIWTEHSTIPSPTSRNLKLQTQQALQSLQRAVDGRGGGGVLYLSKPSEEELAYLEDIVRKWAPLEIAGQGGTVVWPNPPNQPS